MYRFNQFYIPDRMMGAIRRYIEHGIVPGEFLCAVIQNDLRETVGRADEENIANLPAYVAYFYNEAPSLCYGSPNAMRKWVKKQGLQNVRSPNQPCGDCSCKE
jgi:hypothetical protein